MTVKWNSKPVLSSIKKNGNAGIKDAAEYLLDKSLQVVPLDESTLANSGNTSVDENSATVYFDTPYAIKQHEDLTLQHINGRQAKYLENPLKENRKKLQDIIANKIKGAIK